MKIPYKNGKVASGYIGSWVEPGSSWDGKKVDEWREAEQFRDGLRFIGIEASSSASYAEFWDRSGHRYEMNLRDFAEMALAGLRMDRYIDAWWEPFRQGARTRIKYKEGEK